MVEGEAKNMGKVCLCGRNGDYVGTKTWLREKRRTWGKCVCVVCLNVWCNILGMMPHF